jgi:D-amino peptidase
MTMQELDRTFQAVVLVGYHSGAGTGCSPLEHTYSGNVWKITLNGRSIMDC